MCGFVGRLLRRGADLPAPPPLSAALAALERRGPDSWHQWESPEGDVQLLHVRLAIVDQDNRARQPFCDSERGLSVVFNGEIYNYQELRRELDDYPFRTTSDTEVLIACYARWGAAGLQRLRGMFACAIVDNYARRIYLARDPIGKKPLYVAQWPEGVWFGSSVLSLVASLGRQPPLRTALLKDFWRFSYVPPDTSLVQDCRPVAPGEVLVFNFEGRLQETRSCRPEIPSHGALSLDEARERVAELIGQAVRGRLHNNPFPVSLLSGGIDSTVVTRFMAESGSGSAITLRSLVPLTLDERYARYAARRLGIKLDLVRAGVEKLEQEVCWALDLQDEPLAMLSFFPLALLIKRAKEIGKVLLTGDGADEVFLGYGQPSDWQDPGRGATTYHASERRIVAGQEPPHWMSPWGQWMVGHSLVGHMFTKLDRASAEQGVEARCPLVDFDLLTFVRSLRPQHVFFTNRPKSLLKAQLPGWPRWFVERRKLGFAYNMRWAWGARAYHGLREGITPESIAAFGDLVPHPLRQRPRDWSSRAIFRNFTAAWTLLAWSRFIDRFAKAGRTTRPPAASEVQITSAATA